jgi:hypothetical protein
VIRVYRQLTRYRIHGPLDTPGSKRKVILAPAIVKLLRERWLAPPYKRPSDLVFCIRAVAVGQVALRYEVWAGRASSAGRTGTGWQAHGLG